MANKNDVLMEFAGKIKKYGEHLQRAPERNTVGPGSSYSPGTADAFCYAVGRRLVEMHEQFMEQVEDEVDRS